jgi:NTP pyrophosphatase (non-canonical NTP hydrolase)
MTTPPPPASLEKQHDALIEYTVKSGQAIMEELTTKQAHLIHMVMGIAGEAGELLDAVKKSTIYQRPIDMENIVEELGDLEYYMKGLRRSLGITRQETLKHNIDKLYTRYAQGYSNSAAQARIDKLNQTLNEDHIESILEEKMPDLGDPKVDADE